MAACASFPCQTSAMLSVWSISGHRAAAIPVAISPFGNIFVLYVCLHKTPKRTFLKELLFLNVCLYITQERMFKQNVFFMKVLK